MGTSVNRLIRRHNKAVYSSLAVRHVAEQIDTLYWEAGAADQHVYSTSSADGAVDDALLRRRDNLRLDE